MALCAYLDNSNHVIANTTPLQDCTGLIIIDSVEYTDYPTLSTIFNQPLAGDLGQMWLIGFSLPIIIYLSAWAFGEVISFVKDRSH